ncbi:GNAT family N-acetyltransferase [Microbacterium kyungheense]|uniref:RimJ/RimL family protein N-acetyltransferase n=1 Tax=Microbacterium kyungheense TaxID=1263636 RepID=A0A543EEU9_9MICO|nr:GNAT family N-acetyltransferase [Microbacterium kyungheense]TQM20127.1 RimJ/RimL family protein N-acetyltransferase [Microbacterium kyungheense]
MLPAVIDPGVDGLSLHALSNSDAVALHALVQRNRRHLTAYGDYAEEVARDVEQTAAWLESVQVAGMTYGLNWRGELIGLVGLTPVDPPRYGCGYWIDESHAGRGLTRAGLSALVAAAKQSLGATDVYAGVTRGNLASVGVLRSLGFELAEEFPTYERFHLRLAGHPDPRPRIFVATADDVAFQQLASAFIDWPKPSELFDEYRRRQASGDALVLIACAESEVAGYCLVEWTSSYPPFASAGVPEIIDLNVLPAQRGLGAGRRLLAEAELRASTRSDTVGLRVGLYADYGVAQQMYVRAGFVPDGRGVSVNGQPVPPGAVIRLDDEPVLALTRCVKGRF